MLREDANQEQLGKLEDSIWTGLNRAKRLLSDWEFLESRCSELKARIFKLSYVTCPETRDKIEKEIEALRGVIREELSRLEKLY